MKNLSYFLLVICWITIAIFTYKGIYTKDMFIISSMILIATGAIMTEIKDKIK